MDKIIIKGIEVFAYHGALSEENSLGQRFTIDITMKKDIRKACINDTLEDTVHYGFVHDDVVTLTKNNKFKLIEKLAEELAKMIVEKYGVEEVTVSIEKPNAPINGIFKYVAVEITRSKKDYE
ncbi:MAG: dihydroneopterin aldolase [Fusobacteriaceae bacterium]|jgi:dihydroneopterin aldolase|nr:dihydroneopterin aldolase [Fusobacteriaceae bacterium]MBU9917292.1 dihydroneopterin aldolase [Fusobacteriaceae bacterium]